MTTNQKSLASYRIKNDFIHTSNSIDLSFIFSTCNEGTTWVTIFGFPPSAASYILQQFSQCGTVLQHHIPANGNWMNIRYQTK